MKSVSEINEKLYVLIQNGRDLQPSRLCLFNLGASQAMASGMDKVQRGRPSRLWKARVLNSKSAAATPQGI